MIRSKRGLAVLGACGLIIGVVALSSSAVHAEKGANWMVNGNNITGELLPTVSIASVVSEDMALLTEIAKTKVRLLCKGAEFLGARLEAEGKVGGKAGSNTTKFTGCEMYLNGVVSKACEPRSEGKFGTFTSTPLKGLLVLHELAGGAKDTLIRFEPVAGTVFATVQLGEECSIGSTCAISGVSTVKDSEGKFGVELVNHLVEQGPLSELWVGTKTAEHMAVVDGSASLRLTGAHEGLKWSALPG
jgi:hypothetical protein